MDALPVQALTPSVIQAPVYVCVRWSFTWSDKHPFTPTVWCVQWQEKEK